MRVRSLLLLAASLLGEVPAKDVYYEWTLDTFLDNEFSPDCMNDVKQGRSVFVAEESFPGPTIDVMEGDTVHVSRKEHNEFVEVLVFGQSVCVYSRGDRETRNWQTRFEGRRRY